MHTNNSEVEQQTGYCHMPDTDIANLEEGILRLGVLFPNRSLRAVRSFHCPLTFDRLQATFSTTYWDRFEILSRILRNVGGRCLGTTM